MCPDAATNASAYCYYCVLLLLLIRARAHADAKKALGQQLVAAQAEIATLQARAEHGAEQLTEAQVWRDRETQTQTQTQTQREKEMRERDLESE
jgi:hypothetical protein